jgi:hypothetical protein
MALNRPGTARTEAEERRAGRERRRRARAHRERGRDLRGGMGCSFSRSQVIVSCTQLIDTSVLEK